MTVDLHLCTYWLRSCVAPRFRSQGQQLHQLLFKSGHASSLFASNCLLQMYARCGPDLTDSRRLFDEMPHRNCFSWNLLLDACLKLGDRAAALELFDSMSERNTFSWNAIVTGLVRYGDLENARRLFEEMPMRDAVACNAVIHGYARKGQVHEAFRLFKEMGSHFVGPSSPCNDGFVLATVLSACADHVAHDFGKQIHARIVMSQVDLDTVLGSTLVNMYAKCEDFDSACLVLDSMLEPDDFSLSALISGYADHGSLVDARKVFDKRENPGVVLWNSIINGYVINDQGEEALHLFRRMRREGVMPDSSTLVSLLGASMSFGELEYGKQLHACCCRHGLIENIVVASALIDSYSKSGYWEDACKVFSELKVHDTVVLNSMINVYSNCGRIVEARRVFKSIPSKSLISWNSMIVGNSQNGCAVEALEVFSEMHRLDLRLDKVALASAVSACASICLLGLGEQIFAQATLVGLESDVVISSSIIDLYCKCGGVSQGRRLFNEMRNFDVVLWNSMLMGYASNGYGIEVLELFETMRNAGVSPNVVTFIALLSGCCHCGLIEEGLRWFHRMKGDYGIEPVVEHYSCIVDLLVRAGRLKEAVDFIDTMPFETDASMWTSVLGGCKAHGDEALGNKVAEKLIELNPQHSGSYVQLSSIYAAQGDWESSVQVRQMMHERRIKKNPGFSWI
ncbi:putative pentatricopeptide repeat-containing protein At1g77010, mitochondrial [Elaeis guineensis]|uniref:Pentatricopeptide repeat-containing protein At1g77010, mitochondrial n=1 Tax=Elaeis guineensis var. tenera TaxID=51953 RepID=A0A6I9QL48_ELAGV|nr:putative pentatricopeptide repeat-containing protein At1g77010, mitochondrial [Elaeis guineensis]